MVLNMEKSLCLILNMAVYLLEYITISDLQIRLRQVLNFGLSRKAALIFPCLEIGIMSSMAYVGDNKSETASVC